MKTLISMFALALALAFTGPAFAGDVTTAKNGRLRKGWRHMGRCNQSVLREEDVTFFFPLKAHKEGRSLR